MGRPKKVVVAPEPEVAPEVIPAEEMPPVDETPVVAEPEVLPEPAPVEHVPAVSVKYAGEVNPESNRQSYFFRVEKDGDECHVSRADGMYIRTYSHRIHGADFEKLANEFATKQSMKLSGFILAV